MSAFAQQIPERENLGFAKSQISNLTDLTNSMNEFNRTV